MTCLANACGSPFADRYQTAGSRSFLGHVKKTVAFIGQIEGRDKFFKLAEAALDTGHVIASTTGASAGTVQGVMTAYQSVKTGREIFSLLNVFNGVIPTLMEQLEQIPGLLRSLATPGESYQYGPKSKLKNGSRTDVGESFKNTAKGPLEKSLALAHHVFGAIGSAGYIAGFGLCRPLSALKKYAHVDLGSHANKIGSHFSTAMFVVHIAGVVKTASGMALHTLTYLRFTSKSRTKASKAGTSSAPIAKEYWSHTTKQAVGFLDSGLELVYDVLKMTSKGPVDPRVRLPLTLLIGVTGVTKVWISLPED